MAEPLHVGVNAASLAAALPPPVASIFPPLRSGAIPKVAYVVGSVATLRTASIIPDAVLYKALLGSDPTVDSAARPIVND